MMMSRKIVVVVCLVLFWFLSLFALRAFAQDIPGPRIGEVGGHIAVVGVEFTRPANTTPYTVKTSISTSTTAGTIITFPNVARVNGGTGYLVKARAMTDNTAWTSQVRLHLYNTAPVALNDAAAFVMLYTNAATRIGYIDFTGWGTEGTGSTAANAIIADLRLAYKAGTGTRDIFARAEAVTAGTPTSGQKFFFELTADNN